MTVLCQHKGAFGCPFRTTSTCILPILSPPTHCLAPVTSVSPIWVIFKEYLFTEERKKYITYKLAFLQCSRISLLDYLSFLLLSLVCSILLQSNILQYRLSRICLKIYRIMVLGCDGGTKNPLISLLKPQYKNFIILQHFINRVSVWMYVHASCQHTYV